MGVKLLPARASLPAYVWQSAENRDFPIMQCDIAHPYTFPGRPRDTVGRDRFGDRFSLSFSSLNK
jgi:hypothetical protein